ncbi:MAG: hypothetical protein ACAH89_01040 [Rariglobus sp.]
MSNAAPKAPKPAKKKAQNTTWEHPEKSGIKIAEMPNKTGGKVFGFSYQVRIPSELLGKVGQREIYQRKTKAEAERLAEDRFLALKKHGTAFADIPPTAQKQAVIAWGMLKEHGLGFIEAAEAAIKALRPEGGQRTLAEVLGELRDSKAARLKAGALDQRTHDDFKSRSLKIEQALGSKLVGTITPEEVSVWLRSLRSDRTAKPGTAQTLSQRSTLNYRNTLSEVFRHAKVKRYCSENPLERFSREDYKSLGGERAERDLDGINILTVTDLTNPDTARLAWSQIHELRFVQHLHESITALRLRVAHGLKRACFER